MRRFYAGGGPQQNGSVTLGVDETRHIRDVLRLRIGEEIAVFDGLGREFAARIDEILKKETRLTVIREIDPAAPESNLDLTLAAALLKSEKFDLVVQKAVELGVTRLIPLATRRTDVKLKDAGKRVERWRKIALEASKQCGRACLMDVAEPQEFAEFCRSRNGESGVILFAERSGSLFSEINALPKMTAVTGPEGGWDDAELELAKNVGFSLITLGGRILRAETAAVSIVSILQHRFGDLN
ncbi:MAG: 16S rRNA (uracil(1498)-N(3))-methyltransferase [Acidobacteria bacterium]|nr:16S rRNA (uracil(1498)-N(3))-methyltransferase [Acidobacteriota bacterium]